MRCGCSKCVDEFTGKKLLKEEDVPADVVPTSIDYEGNYGISVQWSDGHGTSIYPYDKMESFFKEFQYCVCYISQLGFGMLLRSERVLVATVGVLGRTRAFTRHRLFERSFVTSQNKKLSDSNVEGKRQQMWR